MGQPHRERGRFPTDPRLFPLRPGGRRRRYPAILAVGGLTDPRVTYWEPAKWVARLRAKRRAARSCCATDMDAGHGGASGRFDRLKEVAQSYAFAIAIGAGLPAG